MFFVFLLVPYRGASHFCSVKFSKVITRRAPSKKEKYGNARAGAHSLVAVRLRRLRLRVFQEPLRLGLLQYIPERVSVLVALLGH